MWRIKQKPLSYNGETVSDECIEIADLCECQNVPTKNKCKGSMPLLEVIRWNKYVDFKEF